MLGPVPTCVHPPLMHITQKALALKPDGPGVPAQALSTLYQQQTSHALCVVEKRHCNTMWYIARHRAEPRDGASLLLQWLLNHFFTSKDNLSFSTRLLPGLQLFQRKCCLQALSILPMVVTCIQLNFSKDTDQKFSSQPHWSHVATSTFKHLLKFCLIPKRIKNQKTYAGEIS